MPRDPRVCRALGKYFFRASVYINNLSHPKSMSQHHSSGQNSHSHERNTSLTVVSDLLARLPSWNYSQATGPRMTP